MGEKKCYKCEGHVCPCSKSPDIGQGCDERVHSGGDHPGPECLGEEVSLSIGSTQREKACTGGRVKMASSGI